MTGASQVQTRGSHFPPPIMTSEPGSFARWSFEIRIPRIIDEVISTNYYSQEILNDLYSLRQEVTSSSMQALSEQAEDKHYWDQVADPYLGRSWLDVPWYFAEAYFYRRLLEVVRYFQSGQWRRCDPFRVAKQQELTEDAGLGKTRYLLRTLQGLPFEESLRQIIYASLWGNRADLSNREVVARSKTHSAMGIDLDHVVVDDIPLALQLLRPKGLDRLDIICDNAGTEIMSDLVLATNLITESVGQQVALHLKAHPFFVSDAMADDVTAAIEALATCSDGDLQALGVTIKNLVATEALSLREHPFWTSAKFFSELPDELAKDLSEASLVFIKGDANYRRLVGDYHWASTTPLHHAVRSFPCTALALRTLKSELILGLPTGMANRIASFDPNWMIDGSWAVAQLYSKAE